MDDRDNGRTHTGKYIFSWNIEMFSNKIYSWVTNIITDGIYLFWGVFPTYLLVMGLDKVILNPTLCQQSFILKLWSLVQAFGVLSRLSV